MRCIRFLAAGGLVALAIVEPRRRSRSSIRAKPITVIVPFAAGGPTDVVARLVGEHMGAHARHSTFVVENIGGAGGSLGMTRAAQAAPDGYTIAVGNMGTQSAAPALYPNLKYDPAKSFAQIGIVNYTPQAIVSKKALATTNLKDFIAYVKGKGSAISYGHAGVGSISHVAGLVFNAKFGLTPNLIPYRGTGPVLQRHGRRPDRLHGRPVAQRHPADQGRHHQGLRHRRAGSGWRACRTCRPPRRPARISSSAPGTRWSRPRTRRRTSSTSSSARSSKALDDPAIKARYVELGSSAPQGAERGPAGLQKLVESEVARITPVIKAANVKVE